MNKIKKGFTLIEITVSLIILSILLGATITFIVATTNIANKEVNFDAQKQYSQMVFEHIKERTKNAEEFYISDVYPSTGYDNVFKIEDGNLYENNELLYFGNENKGMKSSFSFIAYDSGKIEVSFNCFDSSGKIIYEAQEMYRVNIVKYMDTTTDRYFLESKRNVPLSGIVYIAYSNKSVFN